MQTSYVSAIADMAHPSCAGRDPSRKTNFAEALPGFTILAVAMLSLFGADSTFAHCIDYGDYLHWVGAVETPDWAVSVAIQGDYAYVADYDSGLQIVDITTPGSPVIVGSVETLSAASGVAIQGDYA